MRQSLGENPAHLKGHKQLTAKTKRSVERIATKLQEAEAAPGKGLRVTEVCKRLDIREQDAQAVLLAASPASLAARVFEHTERTAA